jgi:hypothetical protein
MGSFNATCIVSNLAIEAGTPVRFLALARNAYEPDGNSYICYVGGRWQIFGVPLKAKYNDYGSVEDIEKSITSKLFFQSLSMYAVEVGTGDNQCHDVPVNSDMDQKGWLEALWEGRIKVSDTQKIDSLQLKKLNELYELLGKSKVEYEPTTGIPTLKRIEKILIDNNYKLSEEYGSDGFLLNEVGVGFIRIRCGKYDEDLNDLEKLEKIKPLLNDYATMITAGTGNYSKYAEILVGPLPNEDKKNHIHADLDSKDYDQPRPVSQAMIREDVWQILLNTPISSWSGEYTFETMKIAAFQALDEEITRIKKNKKLLAKGKDKEYLELDNKNIFIDSLRGHEGSSGFTFREAFRLCIEQVKTDKERKSYVLNLAETIYVQWVYSVLHGQWHPTTNSSQEGNWKEHRAFLSSLLDIKSIWEDEDEIKADMEDE